MLRQPLSCCSPITTRSQRGGVDAESAWMDTYTNVQGEQSPLGQQQAKVKEKRKDRKKRSKGCRSMFGMKADVIDVKRTTGGRFFRGVPLWRCGGDRNRPLLSPGSRSHPSAWSRVCLQGGGRRERGEKNICLFRALKNIDSGRLFLARQVNVV